MARTSNTSALLLATGSQPRCCQCRAPNSPACTTCARLRMWTGCARELRAGRRAVIVGGGYIGLEVAATCREAGLEVTVVEAADRVMNRVVSPVVSQFYEAEHARHGVQILCSARVQNSSRWQQRDRDPPDGSPGNERVAAVRLADGREIPADFVLDRHRRGANRCVGPRCGPGVRQRHRGR